MNIKEASQKAYLYSLFLDNTPQGRKPKSFPIEKVADASTAAKKLLKGSTDSAGTTTFADGDTKFTAEEWILLKEFVNAIQSATILEAEVIKELKEIFSK